VNHALATVSLASTRAGIALPIIHTPRHLPLPIMYSIVIYVPVTHADAVRAALAASGAGAVGEYDSCSFSCRGHGRFRPLSGANPFIGSAGGGVEVVEEERIETIVLDADVRRVVAAVKAAHPYEEPAFHLSAVLDYKLFLGGAGSGAAASAPSAGATTERR
jgi:hypothetical protein